MVGAGRFERPTPCAQGTSWHRPEYAYFHALGFQGLTRARIEACGHLWAFCASPSTEVSTSRADPRSGAHLHSLDFLVVCHPVPNWTEQMDRARVVYQLPSRRELFSLGTQPVSRWRNLLFSASKGWACRALHSDDSVSAPPRPKVHTSTNYPRPVLPTDA